MATATSSYEAFCESLWRKWTRSDIDFSADMKLHFQTDHSPEPYIRFGVSRKPLHFLLTNPGGCMSHQRRPEILAGKFVMKPADKYSQVAMKLGPYYQEELSGQPAGKRIERMLKLATLMDRRGVVQLECIPLHSDHLPSKAKLVPYLDNDPFLSKYVGELKSFLRDKALLAVSAAPTTRSLSAKTIWSSPWLKWLASIVGIREKRAHFHAIVQKSGSVTGALVTDHRNGISKGIYIVMGSNNLPTAAGLKLIAQELNC